MSERHGAGQGLSEHELSEIRMLIEERTGIHFDSSRERFFSTRLREHLHERSLARGTAFGGWRGGGNSRERRGPLFRGVGGGSPGGGAGGGR